ncbi:BTAD domain-containing putative transcriptional regulator [Streptomyces sp. NPDC002018]|uniref:BTAD domain-containing putative transcriptional regulator n=1 Tax=Streptomyces sp. NPDC002018 TaxID=3364629 RepID=UPI0036852439
MPCIGSGESCRPRRRRVTGHLMPALYRCGRQAEALECYEHARRRVAGETGVDPGAPLRRLYEQILTAAPVLDVDPAEAAIAPVTGTRRRPPGRAGSGCHCRTCARPAGETPAATARARTQG